MYICKFFQHDGPERVVRKHFLTTTIFVALLLPYFLDKAFLVAVGEGRLEQAQRLVNSNVLFLKWKNSVRILYFQGLGSYFFLAWTCGSCSAEGRRFTRLLSRVTPRSART